LGISNGTVTRRFDSLKARRVIRPLIQVNPERIGYFSEATFGLIISAETNIATVSNALGRIPDVTAVLRTIGIHDLSVVVQVKSLKHIFSLEAEIARIPGMKEISPPTLNQFPVLPYPGEHLSTF